MRFFEVDKLRRRKFFRALIKNYSGLLGLIVICILCFVALFAPWLAPYNFAEMNIPHRLSPPSWEHPFGTDPFGRDILSRIIWGARISLQVGVFSVFIGAFLGLVYGVAMGYLGGIIDLVGMRFVDIAMSIPLYLLAIFIVAILGNSLPNVMMAIGVSTFPQFARLVRAAVLSVKERTYIESAKALGATSPRVLFVHIVPNILSSLIVVMTLRISTAILTESSLSFLGLGIPPPNPSWGVMVAEGRMFLMGSPWISLIPGVVIGIMVFGFNLFGDFISDYLNPKNR